MKKLFFTIAVIAIALTGELYAKPISNYSPTVEDDGHGHTAADLPDVTFTKIVDGYEAYVSIHTPIVGAGVHFHLNLTDLSNYKPTGEASATIQIGSFKTPENKSTNGIFHFGFNPTVAGKQNISATVVVGDKTILFDLGTLNIYNSVSEAFHAPKAEENPNEIALSKDWMWKHSFGVEIVEPAPFKEVIRTRGEILPATNSQAVIIAPMSGSITFANNIVAGKRIGKSEVIGHITNIGLEDNIASKHTKLEAEYNRTKENYELNKELAKDKIVSEEALRDSYAAYITARENFNSLANIYTKDGVRINAPANSTITSILVSENQYVQAGEIIATATIAKENMLKAEVSKYNYSLIDAIVDANFIPEYSKNVYSVIGEGGAKIVGNIATKENSAYIPIYFSLPNNKNVIPFSYAEVYVIVGSKSDVISVPVEAIAENEGLNWVYVQLCGEKFEKRDVILGGGDGERRVVLSGLEPGDIVVTVGSAKVRQSETSGAEIPHGHTH